MNPTSGETHPEWTQSRAQNKSIHRKLFIILFHILRNVYNRNGRQEWAKGIKRFNEQWKMTKSQILQLKDFAFTRKEG